MGKLRLPGAALWLATVLLALGGCTFQDTLDGMLSPEQQARHVEVANQLCRDPLLLRAHADAQLWQQSEPLLPQLARECAGRPERDARVTSFFWNVAADAQGQSQRMETVVIVAGGATGPWWETELAYRSTGNGPLRITGWTVRRNQQQPASLAFIRQYDAIRFWGAIGGAVFGLLVIGAVFWLVRARRSQGRSAFDP